jgi:hypothetical protein
VKAGVIGGHRVFFVILLLAAAIIIAIQGSAYYYYQQSLRVACSKSCLSVETLVNYGNGTSQWFNRTNIPSDWNFYDLTNNITKVQARYYGPPTSEHFVTGINGVQSNGQYFWSLWVVCQKSSAWVTTTVGADAIHFTIYHTLAWYYQTSNAQDSSSWTPPVPGAAKVTVC